MILKKNQLEVLIFEKEGLEKELEDTKIKNDVNF